MGTLIALTVEADEDWKSVEMPDGTKDPERTPVTALPPSVPSTAEPLPGQYVIFYNKYTKLSAKIISQITLQYITKLFNRNFQAKCYYACSVADNDDRHNC